MQQQESIPAITAKGTVAGLVGTAAITIAVKITPKLLRRVGVEPPLDERSEDEPTERLVQLLLQAVGVAPLPQALVRAGGQVIHWGYGAVWGALYALLQRRSGQQRIVSGLLLSLPTAIVYSVVAPALGLVPQRDLRSWASKGLMCAFQLLYGLVTALVLRRLSR